MLKSFFIIYSILQLLTGTHCDISNNIVSKLLVDMTKFETIQKNYDRNGPSVEVVKVSLDEVTNVAITLSRKLQNYREEFKNLVVKAEDILKNYNETTLLNPDDVLWAREANKSETDKSFVHIPIDIFREEKDIMEAITWTSLLDPLWDDLLNTFTEIKLQFFGSTTGVMRYFPGDKWTSRELDKDEKPIDLYDVRRRTWYIEGMSTPKDVLILIDSSGSSQGQALALMKHMSKQLLDTLTENDFFDVLNFPNEKTAEIGSCFHSFVRATKRNKLKSWEYIEAMTSLGIANFTRALENAFILFNNTASHNEGNRLFGPHCNKMIMLLTDGGNEKPADLLRTYNKYLQIRIFTYLIGPISTNAPAIKWIAEKNRGKFYQIPSIVAIRSQTQDYIRFLADSKAQSNNWLTMTTARYDQMSNDLVLTLVYPLFNMSHGQEPSNLTIMGVLGMHMSIKKLLGDSDAETYFRPDSYIFIVNFQGIAVYHPSYENMKNEFLPVDIADLEPSPHIFELRKAMINGEKGQITVNDYDISNDEHHVINRSKTYNYDKVKDFNLSVAVVNLRDSHKKYTIKYKPIIEKDVQWDDFKKSSLTINKRFLENNVDGEIEEMLESMNATDILEYFYEKFISKNLTEGSDSQNELFFDLFSSMNIEDDWEDYFNNNNLTSNYTGFNILKSRSLWKIYPEKDAQEARSVMKKFELQFEERILKSDDAWVVDVYDAEMKSWNGTTERFLICGRNIKVHDTTLAVVAAVFRDQILRNVIIENSLTSSSSSSSSSSSPVTSVSYLLDDGGIVITADDDEDHVGLFFGDVEPHVMKHMLENRIYRLDEMTRYFSICSDLGSTDDASHITSFFSSLTYQLIIPKLFSFLHGLFTFFEIICSVMVDMVFSDIEFGDEPDNRPKEYCQRNLYKYSFGTSAAKENEFSIDCQNCSKTYKTMRMRDANLMLVLVVSSHHAYDNSADGGSNSNRISDHTTDTQSNQHDNATEVKDACKCYFNESMSLPFKPTRYKNKDFLLSNFEVNSDDSLCLPFDKMEESFSASTPNRAAAFSILLSTFIIFIFTFITI